MVKQYNFFAIFMYLKFNYGFRPPDVRQPKKGPLAIKGKKRD